MTTKEIVNRVATSSLVIIDPEEYYDDHERIVFDLKDYLFEGMILKEKDFRMFVRQHDWSAYKGKNVAVSCSSDAIIPRWAYMLIATCLQPYANAFVFGDIDALENYLFIQAINQIDPKEYQNSKVVIKGCGKFSIPENVYLELTKKLMPYVSSIMYGEPCSTVPVYKQTAKK